MKNTIAMQVHEMLRGELVTHVFLNDYGNKSTFRANEELELAEEYIEYLGVLITHKNYDEIMAKTVDFIGYTLNS